MTTRLERNIQAYSERIQRAAEAVVATLPQDTTPYEQTVIADLASIDAVLTITADDMDAAVDAACEAVRGVHVGDRERYSAALRAGFLALGMSVL